MNNVIAFDAAQRRRTTEISVSQVLNPEAEYFVATLAGDYYDSFGFRDGDRVVVEETAVVRSGDMAIVNYGGTPVAFLVYFDGDHAILHGEKVEIFERSKVEFVGRIVRLERDFI